MNELALPLASAEAVLLAVPPDIEAMVTDESFERVVKNIRDGHAPLDDAKRERIATIALRLENSLVPASGDFILASLKRLAAHYWTGDGDAATWAVRLADYQTDLAGFPADVIDEGVRECRRIHDYWPKISQLLKAMRPIKARRELTVWRLKKLAATKSPKPYSPPSDEQRERISRGLKEIRRQAQAAGGKPFDLDVAAVMAAHRGEG